MRKNTYLSFVLISILLFMLFACSTSGEQSADNTKSDEILTETDGVDSRESTADNIPSGLNFNGEKFTILIRSEDPLSDEFGGKQTGEIIDDGLYARNLSVEERLNVKINIEKTIGNWPNQDEYITKVRNIVQSNDTTVHAFAGYADALNNIGSEGLFIDWNTIDYIDFKQPWWNQSIIEEYTISGKLYFLAGDLTSSLLDYSIVFFFNKKISEDNGITDIYKTVIDNNWTLDKLISLTKTVSNDVNGDGVYDENDQYGLGLPLNSQVDAFYASLNIPISSNSDDGLLQISFDINKMSGVLEKLNDLIYNTNSVYAPSSFDDSVSNDIRVMFTEGKFLFHPNTIYSVSTDTMRSMTDDFGIIPYPKYDEYQDDYKTYAWNQYSLLCIPQSCPDTQMTGAVIEALAAQSYRTVTQTYFENVLKHKYSRDDVSSQMLDIITANIDINFGYMNTGIIFLLRTQIRDASNDIISTYASNESSYITEFNNIMEKYQLLS